jgi:uncharacterized membrane protein
VTAWAAITATAIGCYALKLAGLSLPERILARPAVRRVTDLVPVAVLAALVAVQTIASGHRLEVDARLGALVVAALLVARRAPFLVVVLTAAATAALIRLA